MFKNRFLLFVLVCIINTVAIQAQDASYQEKIITSIFSETEITKSYFYVSLWGPRYRQAYATPISANVVNLNTYKGGLKIVKQLGGKNSRTLLLEDLNGVLYTLRALRKSPTAYIDNKTLKQEYADGKLDETYTEGFIDDMGTGAHPYISLVVGSLAQDLAITHTYPSLIYVPRDGGFGEFSNDFGDALYYVEQQIPSEILKNQSLSVKDTILNTSQVLNKLREDSSNKIDETAYIRARIFDMLIGDWNRTPTQWDWLTHSKNEETIYTPIAKNSDQAFTKMGDGPLMRLTTYFSKNRRHLENYDGELTNPKWLNKSAYALDKTLIANLDAAFWDTETKKIVASLTDAVIDKAFLRVPQELEARISEDIITQLKQRRDRLPEIVSTYVKQLSKLIIIKGTDNDDHFTIERMQDGSSIITGKQKDKEGAAFYKQTINKERTNQIWLYGLEGDDMFEVMGTTDKQVSLSIFGGDNTDTYSVNNKKNVHLYDFPSQDATVTPSDIKVKMIDEPAAGLYDYKHTKRFSNKARPLLGINVDDGLQIGLENTFTDYGFKHTPFSTQHTLSASFYFATTGFDLQYKGDWIHAIDKFDLGLDLQLTSPNYTLNFFGFGNETVNLNDQDPDNFRLNYNRVRIQKFKAAPSVSYRDLKGYSLKATVAYSSIAIEKTENRFIEGFYNSINSESENNFAEIAATAHYSDEVLDIIPFLDVDATLIVGNTFNITQSNNVVYANPKLNLGLPFDSLERFKLTSNLASYFNFNNNIEFYQGASLGAASGLRGYRNQRFTGVNSFVQSSDFRVKLNRLQTKLIPLDIGVYGGFDYGRVWVNDDVSKDWKTSVGGGVFFDTSGLLVGNISAFSSEEGLRVAVRLGVGF